MGRRWKKQKRFWLIREMGSGGGSEERRVRGEVESRGRENGGSGEVERKGKKGEGRRKGGKENGRRKWE